MYTYGHILQHYFTPINFTMSNSKHSTVTDTFTCTDGLQIRVVQRTSALSTGYDVIDSNGTNYLALPVEDYYQARVTAIFEQRIHDNQIAKAATQEVTPEADQKNIVTLGAMYPRPTMYSGASMWMASAIDDLVLINGTHICVIVEADGGFEAITTSDILTKGYHGPIVGTIDGKEMVAIPFPTKVRLEVLLDAKLTDGDRDAVDLMLKPPYIQKAGTVKVTRKEMEDSVKPSKHRREY